MSSARAEFEPAPGLTSLALACGPAELALANALDDDCDGRVDGLADAALLVVLSYPRATTPLLALRSAQPPALELTPPPCGEDSPFCTFALDTRQLPRGRHALLAWPARQTDTGGNGPAFPLLVSVQSGGKVRTYLTEIGPTADAHMLGEVAVP